MPMTYLFRLSLAAIALLLGGCAFGTLNLQTPHTVPTGVSGLGEGRPIAVVVPFDDERRIRNRCGMKKNSYNMDTADVVCTEHPPRWLAERLVAALREADFEVTEIRPSAAPDHVAVEGTLLTLFIEPRIGFWVVGLETDIYARLNVTSPNGLDAERTFFVKSEEQAIAGVEGAYRQSFVHASDQILRDMVVAIGQLLDEYDDSLREET